MLAGHSDSKFGAHPKQNLAQGYLLPNTERDASSSRIHSLLSASPTIPSGFIRHENMTRSSDDSSSHDQSTTPETRRTPTCYGKGVPHTSPAARPLKAFTGQTHDYSSTSSSSTGEPFLGCAGGAPCRLRKWTFTKDNHTISDELLGSLRHNLSSSRA